MELQLSAWEHIVAHRGRSLTLKDDTLPRTASLLKIAEFGHGIVPHVHQQLSDHNYRIYTYDWCMSHSVNRCKK